MEELEAKLSSMPSYKALGKQVILDMQIFDYECDSETSRSFTPTETFDGFLNYNSRMTDRLEDFVCVLVIETSCEASA